MPSAHAILEIAYDMAHPEKTTIKTNAKKEAVEEILETWLYGQIGQNKDESKPARKPIYTIKIQMDLSDDSFHTSSDTGNKGLTCGLLMDVLKRLERIKVLSLPKTKI